MPGSTNRARFHVRIPLDVIMFEEDDVEWRNSEVLRSFFTNYVMKTVKEASEAPNEPDPEPVERSEQQIKGALERISITASKMVAGIPLSEGELGLAEQIARARHHGATAEEVTQAIRHGADLGADRLYRAATAEVAAKLEKLAEESAKYNNEKATYLIEIALDRVKQETEE